MTNPIHDSIKRIMRPMINERKMSIEGTVQHVNYYNNTVRVYWKDPNSGVERESANVPMPIDGNGIFRQSLEQGDYVTLAFKNGDHMDPYITIVHKKLRKVSYQSKYGADIPKGIGFM